MTARTRDEVNRRTALGTALAAGIVGSLGLLLGAATAAIGRSVGGAKHSPAAAGSAAPSTATATPSPSGSAGMAIGPAAGIAVGQAKSFTDPASGSPAWVVHPSGNTFVAFNAICTHAGCTVQYDSSTIQFACPCHGGLYDARTGRVLQGPPPAPLQSIPVRVVSGQLRVDG